MSLGYQEDLLKKLQSISDATADEIYQRLDNMPAKELVALLSSSVQLQFALKEQIKKERRELEDASTDKIVDVKYDNLGVNRNKVINLLNNLG